MCNVRPLDLFGNGGDQGVWEGEENEKTFVWGRAEGKVWWAVHSEREGVGGGDIGGVGERKAKSTWVC